jgi:hypothetical protein
MTPEQISDKIGDAIFAGDIMESGSLPVRTA